MNDKVKKLTLKYIEKLKEMYKDKLCKIILYGAYARYDTTEY